MDTRALRIGSVPSNSMAFTDAAGDTAAVPRRAGVGRLVALDDAEAIAAEIEAFLEDLERGLAARAPRRQPATRAWAAPASWPDSSTRWSTRPPDLDRRRASPDRAGRRSRARFGLRQDGQYRPLTGAG